MTKSEIWILSEWLVARDLVLKRGEFLIHHRLQTPFAEVDLMTRSEAKSSWRLIEVKSFFGAKSEVRLTDDYLPLAISRAQRLRLARALVWIESQVTHPVELTLAVVSHRGGRDESLEIQYFDLEDDDY